MKIRAGFVSNSSSGSFSVPSFLLTDEQKEMLLSLDDMKKEKKRLQEVLGSCDGRSWENSKNDYPINEEYHKIYQKMIDDGNWYDSWAIREDKNNNLISGSSLMDNASIRLLITAIGIDIEMFQFDEQCETKLATHPEAVKHFIWMFNKYKAEFDELSEEKKRIQTEFLGGAPLDKSPYEMTNEELEKNDLPYYRKGKYEN